MELSKWNRCGQDFDLEILRGKHCIIDFIKDENNICRAIRPFVSLGYLVLMVVAIFLPKILRDK